VQAPEITDLYHKISQITTNLSTLHTRLNDLHQQPAKPEPHHNHRKLQQENTQLRQQLTEQRHAHQQEVQHLQVSIRSNKDFSASAHQDQEHLI
jgi:regulator of replication initiation timing